MPVTDFITVLRKCQQTAKKNTPKEVF